MPDEFDELDTENIDPMMFSSPSKKSRGFDFVSPKLKTAPLFSLTPIQKPAQYVERAQIAGSKRKAEDSDSTPISTVEPNKRNHPSSAPAGRSPKSKKTGILSRRRMTASPFTRVNPPSSHEVSSNGLPFSIDAALAGTVPTAKSKLKSKIKSTHRKSWQFEIYEDTPEDEMANLMEHSTCTLDISDDESRAVAKGDRDNKENVPPADDLVTSMGLSSHVAASRRDMMTDETRSPLGDLNAKDYYAEGCDASSIILVPVEDDAKDSPEDATPSSDVVPSSPNRGRANAVTESREEWKNIIARVIPNPVSEAAKSDPVDAHAGGEPAEIQIWESESAKGDQDVGVQATVADGTIHPSTLA